MTFADDDEPAELSAPMTGDSMKRNIVTTNTIAIEPILSNLQIPRPLPVDRFVIATPAAVFPSVRFS